MRRYKPTDNAEFETRQLCLAFGDACRFVAQLAANVKKTLTGYITAFFRTPAPKIKFHQLVLELDAIAQIPLFGASA